MKILLPGFLGFPSEFELITARTGYQSLFYNNNDHLEFWTQLFRQKPNNLSEIAQLVLASWPTEPCDVYGYSFGGRLALELFRQGAPIRSLILESAAPGLLPSESREIRIKSDDKWAQLALDNFSTFLKQWNQQPLFGHQRRADNHRELWPPDVASLWLSAASPGRQVFHWDILDKIPILFIYGAHDQRYCDIAEQLKTLNNVDMVQLDGYHNLHETQSDAISTAILSWST